MGLALQQVGASERELVQMELVLEEQVEPKGFQVQEGQECGVLEEERKEGDVDPNPDRQLEDLQVNWETGEKKKINSVRNTQRYYINIPH